MNRIPFNTTQGLQDWIIENAGPADLVLTSGGRMARQILHRMRIRHVLPGARAWAPLSVISLNEWIQQLWTGMWPEHILASEPVRLHIWIQAMGLVPAPAENIEGIPWAAELDKTYATLCRHLIDPLQRQVDRPLPVWSLDCARYFREAMEAEGLVHPADALAEIINMLMNMNRYGQAGTYYREGGLPDRIFLAGLEQAAPIERRFFSALEGMSEVISLDVAEAAPAQEVFTVSLPDAKQEAEWVVEKALESSQLYDLHRIGIAVTDMEAYGPLLRRLFHELAGERGGEGCSAYNITMGRPVMLSSLVQAALLPLKIVLERQRRDLLVSLIQSPYYGLWAAEHHKLACLDTVWRTKNIEKGIQAMIKVPEGELPAEAGRIQAIAASLAPLIPSREQAKVSEWNKRVLCLWEGFKFPILANEDDRIAWNHLKEGVAELERDLGKEEMSLHDYYSWMRTLFTRRIYNIQGTENAGIQVMGLIESRGLCFDRLFIAGMVSGALPEPVRSFPLLSPEERKRVQGGTVADQYRFAEVLYRHIVASAPHITLSRPEQKDGEPVVPSPFWPSKKLKDQALSVDLWNTQSPVWALSPLLSQARGARGEMVTVKDTPSCPFTLPLQVSVTALDDGFACPFRFFALHCLSIEPLAEPRPGLLPSERGTLIHKCLAGIVSEVMKKGLDLIEDRAEVNALVRENARRLLAPLCRNLQWAVELRRWIDEDPPGLMNEWLEREREKWGEGYRWRVTESPFSRLSAGDSTVMICGRIDRIDAHPAEGFVCWDYKTGNTPARREVETLSKAQLVPYILAVKRGLTCIPVSPGMPVRGGYISLKDAGGAKISLLSLEDTEWNALESQWEQEAARLFTSLARGEVTPSPRDEEEGRDGGVCKVCPIRALCGKEILSLKSKECNQN